MDFKERLLRNDVRHLADNLREVSEELVLLQEFVKHEFPTQFLVFLRTRKDKKNATTVAIKGASLPKIRKLDESAFDQKQTLRSTGGKQVSRKRQSDSIDNESVDVEEFEYEVFPLYPETGNTTTTDCGNDDVNDDAVGNSRVTRNSLSKIENETDEENESNPESPVVDDNDDDTSDYHERNDSDPEFIPILSKSSKKVQRSSKSTTTVREKAQKRRYTEDKSSSNIKPLILTCPICELPVSNSLKLKDHLSGHSEEEAIRNLVCLICCQKYSDKEVYTSHMEKGHTAKDKVSLTCSYCGKTWKSKHHLVEHERIHTGEKPFICEVCDRPFSHNGARKKHLRSVHNQMV